MLLKLGMRPVVIAFHGRFFQRLVYALNLVVGSGVIGFGEPVLDIIALAGSIEDMSAPHCRRARCEFSRKRHW